MDHIQQHNNESYRFEELEFENGMFDSCVDMTYVLTLEDSIRRNSYMEQLQTHLPSSIVKIQHNKGYKNCDKLLKNQDSSSDLNDAYRNVFMDAISNNYDSILLFEDNFFFGDNYTKGDINNICYFINENRPDIYHLGPLNHISFFSTTLHLWVLNMALSHATIVNRHFMELYIEDVCNNKVDLYDHHWNDLRFQKYSYYKPICFQLLPDTKDQSLWQSNLKKWLVSISQLDKSNVIYVPVHQTLLYSSYFTFLGLMLFACFIVWYRNH
jgi:hypothetical protein